jgi:hypothetical protein
MRAVVVVTTARSDYRILFPERLLTTKFYSV